MNSSHSRANPNVVRVHVEPSSFEEFEKQIGLDVTLLRTGHEYIYELYYDNPTVDAPRLETMKARGIIKRFYPF